jgi:integrase/recombinase XerD
VRGYLRWCAEQEHPPALDRTLVRAWVTDLLDSGNEAATAVARQLAVRRFSAWLVEEGEISDDPLLGLKAPKLDRKVTERLSDDEVRRLIDACGGKEFRDRRDEAIVRLMVETGMRAGELLGLAVLDVNLPIGIATVRRGKGGKGRTVPFGPQTGRAIDRYLRMRRSHRLAETSALWLGDRGKELAYFGLRNTLQYRAEVAGITGFHLHVLRHTAAQRWLDAGGSEGGLMAVAGWSSHDMLDRYTRATAADRAADESRRLNLGDL